MSHIFSKINSSRAADSKNVMLVKSAQIMKFFMFDIKVLCFFGHCVLQCEE